MTRRLGWVLIATVWAVLPARALAADTTPTVVLRVRALDSLAEDAKYLAAMLGQNDQIREAEAKLRQVPGIDWKKPLGAYAFVSPGIVDSGFAVMVPVTGEKPILDLLNNFGFKPEKDNDGVYTTLIPSVPEPVYFRFANGYAYVTVRDKAALDKDKLLAPAKVFPAGAGELLSLSVRLDQIPDAAKQAAISQIELRLPDLVAQKQPNESEAEHKLKAVTIKEMANLATALLKDGREIRMVLDLDRKKHDLTAQFSLAAADKSSLAATIASLGKTPSPFAGLLGGDLAFSLGMNLNVPENLSKAFLAVMQEGVKRDLEKEPDATKKALATKLFKPLEPTIQAGQLQSGGALRGPGPNGRFTAVSGFRVREGKALEQALRDLVKELPAEAKALIKLDHAKAGGTSLHRIDPPKNEIPPEMAKLFGDATIYVAVTADAVYVTLGDDGPDTIKQALAAKPGTVALVQAEAAVARLAALVQETDQKKVADAAKQAFQGADKNSDRARFSVEGGDALKVRLHVKTPVLKFLRLMDAGAGPKILSGPVGIIKRP